MIATMPILPFLLATALVPAAELELALEPLPDPRVGQVQGSRAFVALSLDGTRLRVYVCDGTLKRDPSISAWFGGTWDGHSPVTLAAGKRRLRIERVDADGTVRGTLGSRAFVLKRAAHPAGLFDGRRGRTRVTWIVHRDGRMRGTFVPTRPPKCRVVLVTNSSGQQQWVSVC